MRSVSQRLEHTRIAFLAVLSQIRGSTEVKDDHLLSTGG